MHNYWNASNEDIYQFLAQLPHFWHLKIDALYSHPSPSFWYEYPIDAIPTVGFRYFMFSLTQILRMLPRAYYD
jgi:hypothetical protein